MRAVVVIGLFQFLLLSLSPLTNASSLYPWNLVPKIIQDESPTLAALFWGSDPWNKRYWPDPELVTGADDGYGGVHLHDPSIIQYNNTFYSYTTKDLMKISSAPTLHGPWTDESSVIRKESRISLPGRTNPWAPEVHHFNDTFYCFYSVSTRGSHQSAIGLATSSHPTHSWLDHGALFISKKIPKKMANPPPNAIDPTFLMDPISGDAYLTYGSFYGGIYQTKLEPDLRSVVKGYTDVHLLGGASAPVEGSFVAFHDGWYYLWFSHGVCCSLNIRHPAPGHEYSIRVGRSIKVTGPYLDRNGVALLDGGFYEVFGSHGEVYAPGGQGILTVVDKDNYNGGGTGWSAEGAARKRDVLYYHYCEHLHLDCTKIILPAAANHVGPPVNKTQGIEDEDVLLGWNYLEYVGGWPVAVAS